MQPKKLVGAAMLAGLLAAALPAQASVTFDPTCPYTPSNGTGRCGFVGKGDVQTALGWNNAKLQQNANNLAFTYSQPATQGLSQAATQAGSQASTQGISEVVSCTVETVRKTFYRDGSRDGLRDGARDGDRSGSRAGLLSGNVSYNIAYDPRVKTQINGFFLTNSSGGGFVASGEAVWGDWSWSDWSWGDWSWGDVNWDGWVSEPGENPAECLGGNPGVTDLVDTVTEGDITSGDITPEDIEYSEIQSGDVTPAGPATLFVNGKALS